MYFSLNSLRLLLASCLAFSTILAGVSQAELPVSQSLAREHQIKAAFIYNFLKFTEGFKADASGLKLCVYGDHGIYEALKPVEQKPLSGNPIAVLDGNTVKAVANCNVIYIGNAEEVPASVMEEAEQRPILTIGNGTGFTESGGMISLINRGNRLRFVVNSDAAEKSNLRFSAKLLELSIRPN